MRAKRKNGAQTYADVHFKTTTTLNNKVVVVMIGVTFKKKHNRINYFYKKKNASISLTHDILYVYITDMHTNIHKSVYSYILHDVLLSSNMVIKIIRFGKKKCITQQIMITMWFFLATFKFIENS